MRRTALVTRTLHGFTLRRFALFCGIVAIAASGHAAMRYLVGKPWGDVVNAYARQYAYLFLFFGAVWTAVVVAGNWSPARTGPRIALLAAAVVAGLAAGNMLAGPVLGSMWAGEKDAPT